MSVELGQLPVMMCIITPEYRNLRKVLVICNILILLINVFCYLFYMFCIIDVSKSNLPLPIKYTHSSISRLVSLLPRSRLRILTKTVTLPVMPTMIIFRDLSCIRWSYFVTCHAYDDHISWPVMPTMIIFRDLSCLRWSYFVTYHACTRTLRVPWI